MRALAWIAAAAALATQLATAAAAGVEIIAIEYWNPTGLKVLEGSSYELTATGIWTDWFIDCDANGFESPVVMKPFEGLRRSPKEDWFKLVCCVGQDEEKCMPIGTHATVTAPASGELFCYANDMPNWYWNNKKSIMLDMRAL